MKEAIEPAFPFKGHLPGEFGQSDGMTLRDYFAAQMLSSVFSSQTRTAPEPINVAKAAYRIADAMLEARK